MKFLRLLLFPFSLLYALVVIIRNWCYDVGWFKSTRFDAPVIVIGNLAVGGAGKSPMAEYLIRLFKADYQLATLSRGYGRKTTGFIEASATDNATSIGDEPAQFKNNFPNVTVAVCEDRVKGIQQLLPKHNLIILDDAFQHRSLKPGFSILLFDYATIHQPKLLLPAGNLREPFNGRWRADVIVITKCPDNLSTAAQEEITTVIDPLPFQQLFFSSIAYQALQHINGTATDVQLANDATVFLLTGIANAHPLVQHLKTYTTDIVHHNYPDHHQFSLKNITKLADEFAACKSQKKIIVTTEKDAQRLHEQQLLPVVNRLPIFVMPIGVKFLNNDSENFDKTVKNYVRQYTEHHQLH